MAYSEKLPPSNSTDAALLPVGAIVGGVIGGVILLLIICIVVACIVFSTASKAKVRAVRAKNASTSLVGKTAIIVGGTSGIGRGLAIRLAQAGASVTIVGRSQERGSIIVSEMTKAGNGSATHGFQQCNCFSLANVNECITSLKEKLPSIDFVVCSQGMATMQGWTPTSEDEQLDQKLALHVYSRAAFARGLADVLQNSEDGKYMSVLSAGIHSPYANYEADPELNQGSYSIKNAADAAGFYNDIFLDSYSRRYNRVTFLHVAPGFVSTNWGTEMPCALRCLVRCLQATIARSLEDNAEFMMLALTNPKHSVHSNSGKGLYLVNEYGEATASVTSLHETARESVFKNIEAVLDARRSVVTKEFFKQD